MTIIASLHSLGCAGPSDCSRTPVFVRDCSDGEQGTGYNAISRVELQSVRIRREASPVLNPLVAPRSVIEVEQ